MLAAYPDLHFGDVFTCDADKRLLLHTQLLLEMRVTCHMLCYLQKHDSYNPAFVWLSAIVTLTRSQMMAKASQMLLSLVSTMHECSLVPVSICFSWWTMRLPPWMPCPLVDLGHPCYLDGSLCTPTNCASSSKNRRVRVGGGGGEGDKLAVTRPRTVSGVSWQTRG